MLGIHCPYTNNYINQVKMRDHFICDLDKKEFLIPDVVFNNIKKDNVKVKVLDTDGKWYGVTYKEDKDNVCQKIKELVDTGVYPKKLW